ncbi:MAG: NAD(+) synthase [Myxococcales bacterium]|nr:NAD(+) synthase [Myxococcales bacterium]
MRAAPLAAHVAAASLNQTVCDWEGNVRRIREAIAEARGRGARMLVLPELCIPGYSMGDRLMMRDTIERSWTTLNEVVGDTGGMVVMLGLPVRHRDVLYNVTAVAANRKLVGLVPKENLAIGDVQYENRWFSGWPRGQVEEFSGYDGQTLPIGSLIFDADGLGRFAVEVCEDGWKGSRPGTLYALNGAHIVANPSASWFVLGKHKVRRAIVEQVSREDHVVYLYASLLGCDATRLVWDGSVFIAQDGETLEEGRRFLFDQDVEVVDRIVDLAGLERTRMEEGSWRQQVEGMQRGDHGRMPHLVEVEGDFRTEQTPPAVGAYWLEGIEPSLPDPSLAWLHEEGVIPHAPAEADLPHLELELALAMGLREYTRKCGIRGYVVALSGGRDSAMVATLVARSLRYHRPDLKGDDLRAYVGEHLVCAYLATENSGPATAAAARSLAEALGARFHEVDMQAAVDTHLNLFHKLTGVAPSWGEPGHDLLMQNVQARLRGSLIWMVANLHGFLLLSTSNKSEAAVGYATMDGDTSGGVSPIADVPKSLVQVWLRWASSYHGLRPLKDLLAIPATAELRPPAESQTDEADLMPFAVLDQLMFHFVQRGQSPLEMFRTLWPQVRERYGEDPRAFEADVRKFVRMFCAAQWKRERFAISFRVAPFDLDPKTGFRFPPVQDPFTLELDELRRYVDGLVDG